MARIKRLLPAMVVAALLFSLFFVNGSIAEPLGAGLLQQFGVSPGGDSASTQAITRRYSLPVEVANTDEDPVPVTVHGASGSPLTTTINGTVDTNATINGTIDMQDVNDPSTQPFQTEMNFLFSTPATNANRDENVVVPAGKRLIIRYVSAFFNIGRDAVADIAIRTTTQETMVQHFVPEMSVGLTPSRSFHKYGLETWIAADSGTQVIVTASYIGQIDMTGGVDVSISGYLVDMP